MELSLWQLYRANGTVVPNTDTMNTFRRFSFTVNFCSNTGKQQTTVSGEVIVTTCSLMKFCFMVQIQKM